VIEGLPRVRWCDVVKLAGAQAGAASSPANAAPATAGNRPDGDADGNTADGASASAADSDAQGEETELCPVCLSSYELDEMLLRLPCEHLFHEQCIARWLQQDSSCPQCRFNLLSGNTPPTRAAVVPVTRSEDPEAGTEMASRVIGGTRPQFVPVAASTSSSEHEGPDAVADASALPAEAPAAHDGRTVQPPSRREDAAAPWA